MSEFIHRYSGKRGKVIPFPACQSFAYVDLGDEALSEQVSSLLRRLSRGRDAFLIEWSGSRVPRGAVIKGQEIAWTQHGVVRSTEGKVMGYYERIIDDLGQDTQVMLVFA